LRAVLAALAAGAWLLAPPAARGDGASRERDLLELRARLEALGKSLEQKEAGEREARGALRAAERAISDSTRRLARLRGESRAARDEAKRLAAREKDLERSLARREASLGRTLVVRHAAGTPEALQVLLAGGDPAELARRLHYLSYVLRALGDAMDGYRAELAELARLRGAARAKAAQIGALEAEERGDREGIIAQRRERQRILGRLAGEIRGARRQMAVLRADEARLARLVQDIGRVLLSPPAVAARRAEPPHSRRFADLRGALRLPVRGELARRSGAPTAARGPGAKGIFIRAPEGEPVRAVAAGQVVFADWMRGFGNLLIIDHGESYMSIYANNESLLKQVGESAAAGETIATVGATGGNEQSGLYFELRHLGRAFDPLRWVDLRR
jgi:septal ring factor EnvC (AmiA/AmiB activator)